MSDGSHLLAWDHLHFNAADASAAADWYALNLGPLAGTTASSWRRQIDGLEVWLCGQHAFWWNQAAAPTSIGSVVDHFGWSVDDVDDGCAALEAVGAAVLEAPKLFADSPRICFLEDPWGAKIELLEDPDRLGFHHVHLLVQEVEEHRERMAGALGGEPDTFRDLLPGSRLEGAWILYRPATDLARSRGRAIDHLAFRTDDIEQHLARLGTAGARVEGPVRDVGGTLIAFAEAPGGVRIELVEAL